MSEAPGTRAITVVTWNLHQNSEAWSYVARLRADYGAQIALLQEAVPPPDPDEWGLITPSPLDRASWRLPVPPGFDKREHAAAIAVLDRSLAVTPILARPLAEASPAGRQPWSEALAASHPGQFAVARLELDDQEIVLVSLYGLWDYTPDKGPMYAEATVHRALFRPHSSIRGAGQRGDCSGGRSQHLAKHH